jgi:hypothetical protein
MKAFLTPVAILLLAAFLVLPSSAQYWRNIDGDIKSGNHSMFRPLEVFADIDPTDNEWIAPEVEAEQEESSGGLR